jgi:hypothetical protein
VLPATLEGNALAVRPLTHTALKPDNTVSVASVPLVKPTPTTQFALLPQTEKPAAARASTGSRSFAQLYLVKGRIVSSPPQAFGAEFFDDTGKATVILSGRRLINGDFELFGMSESIASKYKAQLIRPDALKPFAGADAKGFARFSDLGLQLECVYALTRATGRGEGVCADNEGNTYQIVF